MRYHFDAHQHKDAILPLLTELLAQPVLSTEVIVSIQKKYPKQDGSLFSKDQLVRAYQLFTPSKELGEFDSDFVAKIKLKPVRTISGVAPVTVLTKPFPCPGKCIFCPSDVRMPKSYLRDEPGAQRAERNAFDPYLQVWNRLKAYESMGHTIEKIELIILGGTWSFYPQEYQIWYVKQLFVALNDFGEGIDGRAQILSQMKQRVLQPNEYELHGISCKKKLPKTYNQVISELYTAPEKLLHLADYQIATWSQLEQEQKRNEMARVKCVGLVIETRPDYIDEAEVFRIRRLGCTKAQIGVQSLNDEVLAKNHRGHDVAATRRAFHLLRQAGFKIHAHWMPNLYGSSPDLDVADYQKMFSDLDFRPDELKIYPCSLIESAELMQYFLAGLWRPFSHAELLIVLTKCMLLTPEYCRLTRVIRDIPAQEIVTGNKKSNFRQIAEKELKIHSSELKEIRSREIRDQHYDLGDVLLKEVRYETSVGQEVFLQFVTPDNKILGFLRLLLPKVASFIDEIGQDAVIREVHVYGVAKTIHNDESKQGSQHLGFGIRLIERAKLLAKKANYQKLHVISAVGTREYYRARGFADGRLYQWCIL